MYDTDGAHRVEQVQCEHSASAADKDPPRGAMVVEVDLKGREVSSDPPNSPFAYIRRTHCLINTSTMVEVRAFSDELFAALRGGMAPHLRDKATLRAYVAGKLAVSDPEWTTFLATASDKWKKFPKALSAE